MRSGGVGDSGCAHAGSPASSFGVTSSFASPSAGGGGGGGSKNGGEGEVSVGVGFSSPPSAAGGSSGEQEASRAASCAVAVSSPADSGRGPSPLASPSMSTGGGSSRHGTRSDAGAPSPSARCSTAGTPPPSSPPAAASAPSPSAGGAAHGPSDEAEEATEMLRRAAPTGTNAPVPEPTMPAPPVSGTLPCPPNSELSLDTTDATLPRRKGPDTPSRCGRAACGPNGDGDAPPTPPAAEGRRRRTEPKGEDDASASASPEAKLRCTDTTERRGFISPNTLLAALTIDGGLAGGSAIANGKAFFFFLVDRRRPRPSVPPMKYRYC
eukprot:Rhum_TRINITY_DN14673_c15_g1::Rhum_TRINITY_DN14673_c15_g1_i1::g.108181::m.108181